jgi:hypothetical protein
MNCIIPYQGEGLRFTIFACYLWEIALNVGPDRSLDSMQDRKGIRENTEEVNSTEALVTNDETCSCIFNGNYRSLQ